MLIPSQLKVVNDYKTAVETFVGPRDLAYFVDAHHKRCPTTGEVVPYVPQAEDIRSALINSWDRGAFFRPQFEGLIFNHSRLNAYEQDRLHELGYNVVVLWGGLGQPVITGARIGSRDQFSNLIDVVIGLDVVLKINQLMNSMEEYQYDSRAIQQGILSSRVYSYTRELEAKGILASTGSSVYHSDNWLTLEVMLNTRFQEGYKFTFKKANESTPLYILCEPAAWDLLLNLPALYPTFCKYSYDDEQQVFMGTDSNPRVVITRSY